jgi:2-keto-4-pentenoate hydratase/2-oxohepta-3-ene-1,7-dioic acid hydratase in catechol pathway
VNGEVRQQSHTSQMIFGVAELVSFLSQTLTLTTGDIVATGTPAGVGMASTPSRYLVAGDEVVVEIEGLGRLVNRLRAEDGKLPAVRGADSMRRNAAARFQPAVEEAAT